MQLSAKKMSKDERCGYINIEYYFRYFNSNLGYAYIRSKIEPELFEQLTNIYLKILNQKMERQKSVTDRNAVKSIIDFIGSVLVYFLKSRDIYEHSECVKGSKILKEINDELLRDELHGKNLVDHEAYWYKNMETYFTYLDRRFYNIGISPRKVIYLTTIYVKILNRIMESQKSEAVKNDLKRKIDFMKSELISHLKEHGIYEQSIESINAEKSECYQKNEPIMHVKHIKGSEILEEILEELKFGEGNLIDQNAYWYMHMNMYFECLDCNFEERGVIIDPYEMHYLMTEYIKILKRKIDRQKSATDKNALKNKIDFMESKFVSALRVHGVYEKVMRRIHYDEIDECEQKMIDEDNVKG